MAYNEHEKDLEALNNLPSIRNARRTPPGINNLTVHKAHDVLIKNLEKRVKLLELQLKDATLDIERLRMRQNRASKQQTQRDIDGYNNQQEKLSR
jgi:hypothetical protein